MKDQMVKVSASSDANSRPSGQRPTKRWPRRLRKLLLYALPLVVAVSILAFAVNGLLVTLRPAALAASADSQKQHFPEAAAQTAAEECVATALNFDSQADRGRYDEEVLEHCQTGREAYGRQFGWDGQGSQTAVNASSIVLPGSGPERTVVVSLMVNGPKRVCYQVSTYGRIDDAEIKVGIAKPPRLAPCPRVSSLVRPPQFAVDPQLSALVQTDMATFFTAFAGNDCPTDQAHLAGLMANGLPIEGLGGSVRLGSVLDIAVEAREEALAGQEGDRRRTEVTVIWRDSDAAEAGLVQTYHLTLIKRGPHWLVEQLEESPAPIELEGC